MVPFTETLSYHKIGGCIFSPLCFGRSDEGVRRAITWVINLFSSDRRQPGRPKALTNCHPGPAHTYFRMPLLLSRILQLKPSFNWKLKTSWKDSRGCSDVLIILTFEKSLASYLATAYLNKLQGKRNFLKVLLTWNILSPTTIFWLIKNFSLKIFWGIFHVPHILTLINFPLHQI